MPTEIIRRILMHLTVINVFGKHSMSDQVNVKLSYLYRCPQGLFEHFITLSSLVLHTLLLTSLGNHFISLLNIELL